MPDFAAKKKARCFYGLVSTESLWSSRVEEIAAFCFFRMILTVTCLPRRSKDDMSL